ncbi:dihydropteroate synthase [Salinirubellus salinus]|uniref:Probable bifunctional folylpolyglutamate synthase/dihydropteroate synthase n=1 Tax=Salinirubellus salinus TaxID=1364945 RepID=A0A9E7R2K1_9EURY|nr:dihydropteroate synthase [Salinirubellus salinus]UWM54606.1 dihydropteroate synthase [Salinirubellus salinus]
MEYHEAVNRLERLRRLRPKLGVGTTASLLETLGDPQEGLPAVQVAGSNGKGSTARTLERVLREAGLTVGLYTSPDLNDLRERIRVRGQKIPKHEVSRFVEVAWPEIVDRSVEGDEPTFFETFTALALWRFDRSDVDVAVLEVGIGGRYDATSVVDPVASAVTSVSLEHTEILGDTVEEIARDKANVTPAERPLVTGATGAALDAIRADHPVLTVGPEDADVYASEGEVVSPTASKLSLVGPDWAVETRTPLPGAHMATNAGIAATLARQVGDALGVDVTEADIAAGVRNVHAPGRFEVMDHAPLTVLDGAHNPDACVKLADTLERLEYDSLHLVFGAMREKDHPAMCRALPAADRAYLAEPDVERARGTDTLATVFDRETDAAVDTFDSVLGALEAACWAADPGDCVLATGSLYTVAEARDHWTRSPRVVRTDSHGAAREALASADVPRAVRTDRVDAMVDRTLRFHVRRGRAGELVGRMRSLGGTGAVSGIEAADQHVEVVLTGTLDQFRDLVRYVRACPDGRRLAGRVNRALGIGTDETPAAYPWHDGTAVMGILNVTPDSFHDGGEYDTVPAAVDRAEAMVVDGADIVDVGGESTRPGADPVPAAEERERVVPVVERLADLDTFVSVDTRKALVAEAALEAGADMVNDVTGLGDAAMREVVAAHDVPAVVMHSLSAPVDPHHRYGYDDVVDDVLEGLTERVLLAERAGIDRSNLLLDPGLGFGKRAAESFELLDRLSEFRALGTPVMVGHSHKSMFEAVGCGPDERLAPTVAATALAAERGADVVRVHDVAENVAAVETARKTRGE